jgi:hypothetical protein
MKYASAMLLCLLCMSGSAFAQEPVSASEAACAPEPALSAELARRHATDQLRLEAWKAGKEHGRQSEIAVRLWVQQDQFDAENIAWLKSQVNSNGWPKRCAAGKAGSLTAMLIAQHADLASRLTMAKALESTVGEGQADAGQLAYLQDRNLVEQGKPQIYGTQWKAEGVLYPVADPAQMEARRAAIGLGPSADYKPAR